ncbi:MAG: sugar phosphate isomerase/epimerase family protein [Methanomicrobiales archaeon]
MREPGCTTWCLLDHDLTDALEIISRRTTTVEILADATHDLLEIPEDVFSDTFTLSVHSPTTDINIASVREPIREASLNLLEDVCRKSSDIGARMVVVHPGFSPWLELMDRSYRSLLRSLESLALIQEEYGVPVAIENMGGWEVCHFRNPSLLSVIREFGLSFCLDVGHANLNGVLPDLLSAGAPDHLHLHDNYGSVDDHLPLGEGHINFAHVLPLLPSDCLWICEVPCIEWYDRCVAYISSIGL